MIGKVDRVDCYSMAIFYNDADNEMAYFSPNIFLRIKNTVHKVEPFIYFFCERFSTGLFFQRLILYIFFIVFSPYIFFGYFSYIRPKINIHDDE